MVPSDSDSTQRLRFVRHAEDARPPANGDQTFVLDTAWTSLTQAHSDLRSLRPPVASVVEGHDLFAEALALLDRWAETTRIADIVALDGVTYWFRLREELWHWTAERLLWRYTLDEIDPGGTLGLASVPRTESALIDVARATGRIVEVDCDEPSAEPPVVSAPRRPITRFLPSFIRRAVRRVVPSREMIEAEAPARRLAFLDGRLDRLQRAAEPAVLVLSAANIYQRIGGDGRKRRDPNLGSVIQAIGHARMRPIVIGGGLYGSRVSDWELVEDDDQLLPWDYVVAHWDQPIADQSTAAAIEAIDSGLGAVAGTPFRLDGLDVTEAFLGALLELVNRTANKAVPELALAEQMIEDLRPRAILMTHEGHRVPWLIAAARAGVPTFAVQHGILYAAHPGYPNRRHSTLVLPTCTFVFGDYERRALLAGAYRPTEVVVSGSPRLDLLDEPRARHEPEADRARLRAELKVADGDLMLVISTIALPFMQRFHLVHMLEAVLGGPLPGVHLVFKQHPSEPDDGPYRDLLTGLASTHGYDPPMMSVVRDIDLHRLLRAADAHLGQVSTVLSDAVVAGTPNLIAMVEPGGDILGYIAAGVARPVRDVAELRAALRELELPDPDARRTFIADHFRDGVASERIAAAIGAVALEKLTDPAAGPA